MSVKPTADSAALEAELLRNVLDTVTHDLGGLSSALALRAEVMQRAAPSPAVDACGAIARELRSLGAQLREMSGPSGPGTLSPVPTGSLERWFALVRRFGQPLLGRGVSLRGEVDDVFIGAAASHELTYIVLALFNALREGEQPAHTEIGVSSERGDGSVTLRLGARSAQQPVAMVEDADDEWWRWAVQRAASADIGLQVVGGHIELMVNLANPAPTKG